MYILLLETATSVCSVALAQDDRIVTQRLSDVPNAHSSCLSVFVKEMLDDAGIKPSQLGAVGVSSGPGSYTGLRIGVSSAKGFCYALGIPLFCVPTLQGMAAQYYANHPDYHGMVCSMIDARRMECYTAIFASPTIQLKPVTADVIVSGIYDQWLDQGVMQFLGDGAAKTHDILSIHPNARFASDFQISAAGMLSVVLHKIATADTEDVAYLEPFYLKDFVAKKSVVRGLR